MLLKMSFQLIATWVVCPLVFVGCVMILRNVFKGMNKKWKLKQHSYPEGVDDLLKCGDIDFNNCKP